ncbi:MAG TPA: response regulator [Flavobacterium sp.]|nr:response regulator [Flavobacterium sp.]
MKTNSVKVLIVEDEYITQKTITLYLEESGYNVVGATMNYDETLHVLNTTEVDLALLDINIKGEKNGIEIGNLIHNHYQIPHIYLTAYSDQSTVKNAINTMPYAYLVKPFSKVDLFVSIETAIANFNSKKELQIKKEYIFLKHNEFHVKINLEEINYIESQKNYLLLYTESEVYKYRSTLTDFKPKLPRYFIQIHKGFMVNKHKIKGYNSNFILVNDKQIPISRTFKESVYQLL